MNESYTILILGASGDLTRKKLIPACYQLFKKKTENFVLFGAAIDNTDSRTILMHAESYVHHKDPQSWAEFSEHVYYQQLDFNNLSDYQALAIKLDNYERDNQLSGNRLIYVAASADFYCAITINLALSGIAKKTVLGKFYRIVFEKPFGWDLDSAKKINQCIADNFSEEQIYRVDHYLTKSLVNSIALMRFANLLFEPTWNRDFIDHVQIVFNETVSVGGRIQFYDKYGALKDVVQNHIMQLLSLIAMEKPESLDGDFLSGAKSEVLKNVTVTDGILGQYEGYEALPNIQGKSGTETFVQLRLEVNTDRWKHVPFYVRTGKNLDQKSTEIHIVYKAVGRNFFGKSGQFEPNILTIRISPNTGFSLQLNMQKAGVLNKVSAVKMDFCYQCLFGEFPHAYEVLIKEILKGERSIAVNVKEIEYAWGIIDQAKALQLPVFTYEPGSAGPFEVDDFNKKYHIRWIT